MKTIYLAEFTYGEYRIVSIEVEKETPKQYQIDRSKITKVHGWMFVPQRINKSEHHIFDTLNDARIWCLDTMQKYEKGLQRQLGTVRNMIVELEASIQD